MHLKEKGETLSLESARYRRLRKNREAVAPVISTMMLVVIMLTIVSMSLYWGLPLIRDNQDTTTIRTNTKKMNMMESNLRQCIMEGEGYQLENEYAFAGADLSFCRDSETWIISYSLFPSIEIIYTGLDDMDNFFAIDTEGSVGYPGFDLDDPESTVFLRARIQFIDPKPVLEEPIQYLSYGTGFTSRIELKGFVRITLLMSDIPISEAWIFSIDTLEMTIHTNSREYDLALGNGGLLSDHPDQAEVRTKPFIKENPGYGSLYIGMVDIKGEGMSAISEGRHTIGFEVKKEHAYSIPHAYNMRLSVSGKWSEAWNRHFNTDYNEYRGSLANYGGFIPLAEGNGVSYRIPANSVQETNRVDAGDIELKIGWCSVRCWMVSE